MVPVGQHWLDGANVVYAGVCNTYANTDTNMHATAMIGVSMLLVTICDCAVICICAVAHSLLMSTAVAVASDLAVSMRIAASNSSGGASLASPTHTAVCCLCTALPCCSPGDVNGWPVARLKLCVRKRQRLRLCVHARGLLSAFKGLLKVPFSTPRHDYWATVMRSHACVGQSDACF